jgi:predicted AAA+ superfamily ATPase
LAPFSWAEATQTTKWDSWARRLLERKAKPADLIDGLKPRDDIAKAHEFWFRGGFPEPWLNPGGDFHKHWIEQYFQTYLYRDVKRLFPGLDEMRFRRFIEMLGGLSGRVLNYAEIARALAVSQPTARDYFDIAHGTFLWRRIPAFSKDSMKRLVKHPRGYLRDSGLLHALLHIPSTDALLSHPQMGASWEGMVIEEVLRQLNSLGAAYEYSYYRTGAGAEVDLVLEGDFGRVALEIKYASAIGSRDLRGLREFVSKYKARFGIVINNDHTARLLDDDLFSLPFTRL